MDTKRYAAVEAGGTKFVCAVGTGPTEIERETRLPTTTPEETLRSTLEFFQTAAREIGPISSLGVASFGPVDPEPSSRTYGYITTTPKPGWRNTDVGNFLSRGLGVPFKFDTDVNGAALAEYRWGAGKALPSVVYITVGTGVGGGAVLDGQMVHGLMHPEMGHIPVRRDPALDPFEGSCPFHGDCLEGLASGPAIQKRCGVPGGELEDTHEVWQLVAEYLAQAVAVYTYVVSPSVVVLGGGVMQRRGLFPEIRKRVQAWVNGYIEHPKLSRDVGNYIVPPGLGDRAGIAGAFALASEAASAFEASGDSIGPEPFV